MNFSMLLEAIVSLPPEGQRMVMAFTMFMSYSYGLKYSAERHDLAEMQTMLFEYEDLIYTYRLFYYYLNDEIGHHYDKAKQPTEVPRRKLSDEDFIGMWKDRKDLTDTWVRQVRQAEWNS